jgi:hypothetical protein
MTLETPAQTPDTVAIWEIVSVVTSCLLAEWVVLGFAGRNKLVIAIPVLLAVLLMIISHRERQESLRDIGFRADNFFASCRLLLGPTVLAVALIVASGWLSPGSGFSGPFRWRYLGLPLWALFQQYALNGFINRRAQLVFGSGLKSARCRYLRSVTPAKSLARNRDLCRRLYLGGRLPAATEPLRTGYFPFNYLSRPGPQSFSQSA